MTRSRAYWDEVADRWVAARPQRAWRGYSDRVNARMVEAWLPTEPVDRLLKTDLFDEVATGGLAPLLRRRARRVVAIDESCRMVACARDSGVSRAAADVRRLPFHDAAFDRIFSNSTLDHFGSADELLQAIRELARVLRPGGELLLTLDNMANPLLSLRNALPSAPLERIGLIPYRMGVSCGPVRLRELAVAAGLEVVELGTVMHCPRAPAVAMARVLDGLGQTRIREVFYRVLDAFEVLGRWPSRMLTGYFLTLQARRPA